MNTPHDRVAGAVAGFLCGEALGRPFAGLKGGHIQQLAGGRVEGWLANSVLQPDKPDRNTLPGVHSIHGQEFLAALAARHTDSAGRTGAALCASHLRELHGAEDHSGTSISALRRPGKPLLTALTRWAADYPWEAEEHASRDQSSEGSSAAARAFACFLSSDDDSVLANARLTHLREPALCAARILCTAARTVSEASNPKKVDSRTSLYAVMQDARAFEDTLRAGPLADLWSEIQLGQPIARLSDALEVLPGLIESGDDALAERTLLNQAREYAPDRAVTHVLHGFAPVLIPWILYRAFGSFSLVAAIEDTINRGGDTALAGALIGGLSGARYGIDSIPPEWLSGLHIWPDAKRLAEGSGEAAVDSWLASERRLTSEEERFREPLREAARRKETARPPKKTPKKIPELPPDTGELPFAPPPHAWLHERGDELAPWEKQRLKSERGRRRIDWKEERRQKSREEEKPE